SCLASHLARRDEWGCDEHGDVQDAAAIAPAKRVFCWNAARIGNQITLAPVRSRLPGGVADYCCDLGRDVCTGKDPRNQGPSLAASPVDRLQWRARGFRLT